MSSSWIDVGGEDAVSESLPLSAEVDGVPVVVVRCGTELYAVVDAVRVGESACSLDEVRHDVVLLGKRD